MSLFIVINALGYTKLVHRLAPHHKLKEANISPKHNRLKNSNWQDANLLSVNKHDRGVQLGFYQETTPAKWSE